MTDLASLIDALGPDRVITDSTTLDNRAHDDAEWAPVGTPLALVLPRTAEEVQETVRWAIRTRTPVVARGAGTGLSGAANAIDGCLIVAFDHMAEVVEVNVLERWVRCQPGIVNDTLRAAVKPYGLWYPPDPASSPTSQIGGNIATNAGGMCCVKYGVTSDYVLELQIVTGTGDLVRIGHRTAKGVAGYDLVSLLVGSEGTLGIVTEATLRLRRLPHPPRTVAGFFPTLVAAGEAVRLVAEAGIIPSALELVDRHCLEAVDRWQNLGLSVGAEAVLIARTDTSGDTGLAEAETFARLFAQAGATSAKVSQNEAESDALYSARRLAYPAVERLGPVLTEDIVVPMGSVPLVLEQIQEISRRNAVLIATIAHAGDGNLHPLIIVDPGDASAQARAQIAFDEIVDVALDAGGTVTGEHGVGLLKLPGLAKELGPEVTAMHHAIKDALDPYGILNPGKAIPAR